MEDKMELFQPVKLRYGSGNGDPKDGLCLMQMVDWFSGSTKVKDNPKCASPVLCQVGIKLNDTAKDDETRNRLWPLVWKLLDSNDPEAEFLRIEFMVHEITHRIVAPLFNNIDLPEHTEAVLKATTPEEIKEAIKNASEAVSHSDKIGSIAIGYVTNQIYEAASGLVSLKGKLERIEFMLTSAYYASSAATYMLHSIEYAGLREEEISKIWDKLLQIFIEAIDLGKHGEEDPVYVPRAVELKELLEVV
jgi:hypothetical protein